MATADQIKALIQSRLQDDDARFYTIAMQIAAHAARKGQGKLADDIRALVDQAREQATRRPRRPVPIAVARGELEGILAVAFPDERLSDMVLEDRIRHRLFRIVREYRSRAELSTYGLHPRRKLLLIGPPGSGKTMTASALAGELGLPLMLIRLDGLITKFMGETAAKLRLVFDHMVQVPGVYFFDEFDAIGSERAGRDDVGEIRRVLNSFLMFIEQDQSDSIVAAATNHGGHLDRALFRRFDDIIEYDVPGDERVLELLKGRLSPFDTSGLEWATAVDAGRGLSYADLARGCEDAAKDAILQGTTLVDTVRLVHALQERKTSLPR
jgi:SpoVK/Ycf46/Vps4 family AAA+-type ATPase